MFDQEQNRLNPTQSSVQSQVQEPIRPMEPSAPSPNVKSRGSGLLILKIIVIILVIAVVGVGSVSAYYFYSKMDFEKSLQMAVENTGEMGGLHYEMVIEGRTNVNGQESDGEIRITGNDVYNETMDMDFDIYMNLGKAMESMGIIDDLELELSIKYINEVIYFSLLKAPEVPVPVELDDYYDQWIKVDLNEIQKQFGFDKMLDSLKEQNPEIDAVMEEKEEKQKMMQKQVIERLLIDKPFEIVETKKVDLEGERLYLYKMVLNKENARNYIKNVATIMEEEIFAQNQDIIDKILSAIKIMDVDLYIEPKSDLVRKVVVKTDYEVTDPQISGSLNITTDFSQYNQIEEILPPEKSIDIQIIINKIMYSMFEPPIEEQVSYVVVLDPKTPNELEIDSDMDGLADFYEMYFYGTDPQNADSDEDGYEDLEEIKNGYDPMGAGKKKFRSIGFRVSDGVGCNGSMQATRTITKYDDLIGQQLEDMIIGLNEDEQSSIPSYASNVPSNVKVNNVKLYKKTLWIDFSEELNRVAGSCAVQAARSEIENTFFGEYKGILSNVIISVNGEVEEVLQP